MCVCVCVCVCNCTIGVQQTKQTADDTHEVVVPRYNILSNRGEDTQKKKPWNKSVFGLRFELEISRIWSDGDESQVRCVG